jgi:hypothetical protein
MQSHSKNIIDSLSCPFAIDLKDCEWHKVTQIISIDDKQRSVVVEMMTDKFLVNIPQNLYDAIYRSGEKNVIDGDFGFDEIY